MQIILANALSCSALSPLQQEVQDRRGITVRDGAVILDFGAPYDILLKQIETPLHLLSWVRQLSEKNWMTLGRLRIFVEVVARHKGWTLD